MLILAKREVPGLAALYLASLGQDRLVEFVDTLEPGLPKARKWVMMVSTQIGCAVGCLMCDAGALGYGGNLSREEILAQVRHIAAENHGLELSRHPKVKIHFARMGEPSLNPEVLGALKDLAREFPGPGVIPSLSTVAPKSPAVEPFFEDLLRVKDSLFSGGRFQLQFSLHATGEDKRREIVPIRKWSLEEVAAYGERFVKPGDRKVTLNFALAEGEGLDPEELGRTFDPGSFLVKITPVNPTRSARASGRSFAWTAEPAPLKALAGELQRLGFTVILSPSLPEEIAAETSCGQLWSGALKDSAEISLRNRRLEAASYITSGSLSQKAEDWARELALGRRRELALHPQRAGLLVVDLQEFFLRPDSPAYLPPARAILPNARRLVEAFRRAGSPVFFIYHAHEEPSRDGGLMTLWWRKVCLAGSRWARISPVLEPGEGETFRKCRYSAWTNPSLERALRGKGLEELVVCGIVTNLCVESTVRDAFDAGFMTFVAADATAAHGEGLHLASLRSLAQGFSCVRLTREILAQL